MYVYGACLFYVCCSDCVGVCGNVCCVAAVVKNSFFSLGVLKYVVCLCSGCDGCCVFCLYCDAWSFRCNLGLTINNKALPMATHPKVLGLTLDPKLTCSTHIHNISVQAHTPLQIINALTATGWGKQKGTFMATYKAVMRPALEYASSVWLPIASSTSINKQH